MNEEYIMHKSIMSTPTILADCLKTPVIDEIKEAAKRIVEKKIKRIIFTGCGTSMIISFCCCHYLNALTPLDAFADSAYELDNYPVVTLRPDDAVVSFSHSGGTKAVVDYVQNCRKKGVLTIGVTEVSPSRLSDACELAITGPGGKDAAIPKTRSYSSGIYVGLLLCAYIGEAYGREINWDEIRSLPALAGEVLKTVEPSVKAAASAWSGKGKFVLVGSGTNYITAKEGSLKILETVNLPAINVQVEELAHGNGLYLDKSYGVIFIEPGDCRCFTRLCHMVDGSALTGADVMVISNKDAKSLDSSSKGGMKILFKADVSELLSNFLFILPLQLFAYYLAVDLGKNPDLVSTVRVEMQEAVKKLHPPGFH